MYLDLSYRVDGTGRTATTNDQARRIRNLIEAVLFNAPGERVNRPDFGSGVNEMLFDNNSDALSTAADFLIRSAIQRHLSDLVVIDRLTTQRNEGELHIFLSYAILGQDEMQTETFLREV